MVVCGGRIKGCQNLCLCIVCPGGSTPGGQGWRPSLFSFSIILLHTGVIQGFHKYHLMMTSMRLCFPFLSLGAKGQVSQTLRNLDQVGSDAVLASPPSCWGGWVGNSCGERKWVELLVPFTPRGISVSLWINSHSLGQLQRTLRLPHGIPSQSRSLEERRKGLAYRTFTSMIHQLSQPKTHSEFPKITSLSGP